MNLQGEWKRSYEMSVEDNPLLSHISKVGGRHSRLAAVSLEAEGSGPAAALPIVNSAAVSPSVVLAGDMTPGFEKQHYFSIERYRLLCNRVAQVANNFHTKVFLTASAIAEEGKTLTTANLAYAMSALEGRRTLLIEMDLRRPSLRRLLGVPEGPGEASYLEAADWHSCLFQLRPNLHALLAHGSVERPDEMLHSSQVKTMLEEARNEYDFVLIDSAPLLLAVDTHVLLPMVDHALLVMRADHTPIECSQDAIKMLGDKALGIVLNDVKRMKYESYYRAYYR
jgi:capsular exopolysaccharide synthesis family protein